MVGASGSLGAPVIVSDAEPDGKVSHDVVIVQQRRQLVLDVPDIASPEAEPLTGTAT